MMKIAVVADAHIFKTPDGHYWSRSVENYEFWTRYLNVFEDLRVISRVKEVDCVDQSYSRMDGPHIEVSHVPFFRGPKQLLKRFFLIQKSLKKAFEGCDCALFRVPSLTAFMAWRHFPKSKPCAAEIVSCTRDYLVREKRGINKFFHYVIHKELKRICKRANGTAYVTEKAIQRYYPSYVHVHGEDDKHFTTSYSTITLQNDSFSSPRSYVGSRSIALAITNDSMNGYNKGEHIVIRIVSEARKRGYNLSAIVIGDGSKKKEFEHLSIELGVSDFIQFVGHISSPKELRSLLQRADIYVLPTQVEGLPRSVLEAMAVGMPVLSTPVGGIPEIIDGDCLFSPDDVDGFTNKICFLADNPLELDKLSSRNFARAKDFRSEVLSPKRASFYMKLKQLSRNQNND